MTPLQRFGAYAQDFEATFKDDDWSRLAQYFAPDATYEVSGDPFTCSIRGRDAIFTGIKKSLDGFDRHFATRDIALESAPVVDGDTVSLSWAVTYGRPGTPPLVLRGRSSATYDDGRIARLADSYDASALGSVRAWMAEYGRDLNPSYV
jgi:SnoaL-like domain